MNLASNRKLLVYAMNLIAFGTLHLSGEMSAVQLGLVYAGLVASWFFEPPRVRLERFATFWTVATVAMFAWSIIDVVYLKEQLLIGALNFVLFLQVTKLFQRKENKDYTQSMALSLLVMAAGTALNENLSYGVLFAVYVLVTTPTLVLQHMTDEIDRNRAESVRRAGLDRSVFGATMGLATLVLAGAMVFFFVFPRLGFGFFAKQSRAGVAASGFNDEVTLGEHGTIQENAEIVMRVKFPQPMTVAEVQQLHWRGLSLSRYDGRRWYDQDDVALDISRHDDGYGIGAMGGWRFVTRNSKSVEVYLEPMPQHVLFAPGKIRGIELTLNSADIPDSVLRRGLRGDTSGTVKLESRNDLGLRYVAWYREPVYPDAELRDDAWFAGAPDLGAFVWAVDAFSRTEQARLYRGNDRKLRAALNVFAQTWVQRVDPGSLLPVDDAVLARLREDDLARYVSMPVEDRAAGHDLPPWHHMASTYLQLAPGVLTPRMRDLTTRFRQQHPGQIEYTRAIVEYLKQFDYTTTLPESQTGDNLLDRFLFEWRSGHCEYFASAMVILMRAQGFPARIVNGYLGGEYNSVGEFWAVRQSFAHSWVEVYFPQTGWVQFDPTPGGPVASAGESSLWNRALMALDTARLAWFRWVVEYDFEKQVAVLKNAYDRSQAGRVEGEKIPFAEAAWSATKEAFRRMKSVTASLGLLLLFGGLLRYRAARRKPWGLVDWLIVVSWTALSAWATPRLWPAGESWVVWVLALAPPLVFGGLAWLLRRALLESGDDDSRERSRGQAEVSQLYVTLLGDLEAVHGPQPLGSTVRDVRRLASGVSEPSSQELDAFLDAYEAARFGGAAMERAVVRAWRRRIKLLGRRIRKELLAARAMTAKSS